MPEYGLRESATYTITPGRVALVFDTPRDKALLPGASYRLSSVAYDRVGNQISDLIDFAAADPNVTVVGDLATARPIGRGRIVARSRSTGVVDTVYLNAVPDGVLAAFHKDLLDPCAEGAYRGVVARRGNGSSRGRV